jgi:hypothetical protein
MTKKPYPSDTQDRFIVRLPEGMRERIAAEAKTNNRSMNAEIVHILHDHYTRLDISSKIVDEHVEEQPRLRHWVVDSFKSHLPELRLTLDAGDQPISWDEIYEYMRAIREAMDVKVVSMQTTILTRELASSEGRQKETAALAKKLRSTKPKA